MKPAVIFVWSNFGPYHIDRLETATQALALEFRVIGVEIAGSSAIYDWIPSADSPGFERITLFPRLAEESVSSWRRLVALLGVCVRVRPTHVFLCHYERIETFLIALLLRLFGRRAYCMIDAKFDDKPRSVWFELAKSLYLLPFSGALVSGGRTRSYMEFLGFAPERIAGGYDAVSVARIRRAAEAPPAPDGRPFAERHFTIIARFVPKKNVSMALQAYSRYCRAAGGSARALHLCGSGMLEQSLREEARTLGLSRVVFRGFVQAPEIARVLASTLALILPSTEEQWGLVVNEAVAMGVPILCSENVGARDLLVRTGLNGYAVEADNPDGLANVMRRLAETEDEWRRLAQGSRALTPLADTAQFGIGVRRLMGLGDPAAVGESTATETVS